MTLWHHLRMKPEDDPEARIRQLEQPLADHGAVELGTSQRPADDYPGAGLPPPVYGPPQPYPPQSPYGAPPFGVSFPPGPTKSGASVGLILGLVGVVAVFIVAGIGALVWTLNSATDEITGRPGSSIATGDDDPRGGSVTIGPSRGAPTVLPPRESGDEPKVAVAPAGGQYSVSGVDENETVECNGSNVTVSGFNNTVTLLGHCLSVTVSGVENQVSIDSADKIGASGFDNRVVYHSGDPEVNVSSRNTVTRS